MKKKTPILRNGAVQSLLASLLCILLGLLLGYIALLFINPAGAGEAILTIVKNFMTYSRSTAQLKYLGSTLVKVFRCCLRTRSACSTSARRGSM